MSGPRSGPPNLVVRGAGALAADVVGQAAELVAVLARQAGQEAAAAQAQGILARASALAVSNELAFTRASRELDAATSAQGDAVAPTQTLTSAADVPLRVCQVASELVALAGRLAAGPMSDRRADLCGVVQITAGACNAAAALVRASSILAADDPRRSRASQTATATDTAARRILEELSPT